MLGVIFLWQAAQSVSSARATPPVHINKARKAGIGTVNMFFIVFPPGIICLSAEKTAL
jgi:hypothetical protein